MEARPKTWPPRIAVPALVVVALAAFAVWSFVAHGTPPRRITLATGPAGGSYAEIGEHYRAILARSGVEVGLLPTAGDVENLAKLGDARSGVSAGFVMSGLPGAAEASGLESLGTIAYEPVWLFERSAAAGKALEGWPGKRLSLGPEGSGTRALASKLLGLVGVDTRGSEVLGLPPAEAAEQLLRGDIDAFVLVADWESPLVRRLVAAPQVALGSFRRADAFVALNPDLYKLVLPMGVGDLATNRPPADVTLIAPKASLVVRGDLHEAIQYLLLEAATEVHSRPGIFHRAGEFPAAEAIDFPLSEEATRFHKSGRPFLQRYLPFWMAVLAERLLFLLVPLLGLVLPLVRIVPGAYRTLVEWRIVSLYGGLKLLEAELETLGPGASRADALRRLDDLEARASHLRVPLLYSQMLYTLKLHIGLVRDRLARRE